jgi:hypothetical protein
LSEQTQFREKGQSLVLVAASMVALVIFVAITVDVSSAYYHRRTAQNGADAAALAGVYEMSKEINHRNKRVDDNIKAAMNDFAERNGIEDTGGVLKDAENANVLGYYVDTSGNRVQVNGVDAEVGEMDDLRVPPDAYGIEAITFITAPTYFGGIFGFDGYPLEARAVSLLKQACTSDCVVPITTDASLLFDAQGNPMDEQELCFNIWRESQTDVPTPGLYGWVNWTWQELKCEGSPYSDGRPCPLVDQGQNACNSPILAANLHPDNCGNGYVEVGDWISSTSGVVNADDVRCMLLYYMGSHDLYCNPLEIWEPHPFTIPVYSGTTMDLEPLSAIPCLSMDNPNDPTSGGLHYYVSGFAKMQLLGFQLSQGGSVTVNAGNDGTECITIGETPHNGNRITAEFIKYVTDYDSSNECYDPEGSLLTSGKLTE